MRKTAAVLAAALLTLTACGGDEEGEAKDNIRAAVLEGDADVAAGVELTEEQADCFADGLVDELGVEKLSDYGFLDEDNEVVTDAQVDDMSAEDAEATADTITGCVDLRDLIREQFAGAGGDQFSEEQADCIVNAIDEDDLEAALAAQLQGEDAANPLQDSLGAIMECVGGAGQE